VERNGQRSEDDGEMLTHPLAAVHKLPDERVGSLIGVAEVEVHDGPGAKTSVLREDYAEVAGKKRWDQFGFVRMSERRWPKENVGRG